jgi:acyl-ACP thioesterase
VSRRYAGSRAIRLSDTDSSNRLRLDAVARYLQDAASDDWADAGFESGESVWVVRRTQLEVRTPFHGDGRVEVETWCSGIAGSSAARRYSLAGDRGGRIEAESIWIHLDHALRPRRLDDRFRAVYGTSAAGRRAPTRFRLPAPDAVRGQPWPLRATDLDRLGHVNNAAYWAAFEEAFRGRLEGPLRAVLEYRRPIDLGEPVELARDGDLAWIAVAGEVRSVARLEPEPPREPEQLA